MRTSVLAIGSLLCLGAKGLDEPGYGAPVITDTPVLYDVATPQDTYAAVERETNMHFAYAEQVLKALEDAVQNGSTPNQRPNSFLRKLSPSTPGTLSINAHRDDKGNLTVTGFTEMSAGSPYVYADNIAWTSPGCKKQGRSHLSHRFNQEGASQTVNQSVWIHERTIESKMTLGDESLITTDAEDPERAERYEKIAARVACSIEAALE